MDPNERTQLVERYRAGYDDVADALRGASDADLDRRPGPEAWTARDVVHHLADSEMRSAVRLRQLLAEDEPTIQGYDEAGYARRLHYDRPIGSSLEAFRGARATTAELLELLEETDWTRSGEHTESGRYSVEDWLRIYASHGADHAAQIREALQR
jgi:hypothetical protein